VLFGEGHWVELFVVHSYLANKGAFTEPVFRYSVFYILFIWLSDYLLRHVRLPPVCATGCFVCKQLAKSEPVN